MVAAMRAAAGEGVVAISAGNYGGKLGTALLRLHDLLNQAEAA
jgi:formylmethanofuran--tetrahydromethanopterin N-formyltransferase